MNTTDATGRPVVVYVAGSGRSGSTLLERVIAETPGYVTVGESVELFRTVLTKSLDGRPVGCGCGVPVLECPFWTAVGERAFGGWTQVTPQAVRLQRAVAAQRHLPRLLGLVPADDQFHHDLRAYTDLYRRLYLAVLAESGAAVVVDASKWPAQAVALSHSRDLDLRVLHLVRDVRGVAGSWTKAGVVKPTSGARQETMGTHHPVATAARWSLFQLEVQALRGRVDRATRVRYEDFVAAPGPVVQRALRELGTPVPDGALRQVDGRMVTLHPSHGLAGNPSRFRHGQTALRSDDGWRDQLDRPTRAAVTTVGLPGMVTCGYLPRRTTRSPRSE